MELLTDMEDAYHQAIAEAMKNGIDVHADHVVKKGAGATQKTIPVQFHGVDKSKNLVFQSILEDGQVIDYFVFSTGQRTRKILLTRIELSSDYTPGADYMMTP
jgi:hypothetical protein